MCLALWNLKGAHKYKSVQGSKGAPREICAEYSGVQSRVRESNQERPRGGGDFPADR